MNVFRLLSTKFSSKRVTLGSAAGSSTFSIRPVSARICRSLVSCCVRLDSNSWISCASERVRSVCYALGIHELVLAQLQHLAVIKPDRQRADQQKCAQNEPQDAHTPRAHLLPPGLKAGRHF